MTKCTRWCVKWRNRPLIVPTPGHLNTYYSTTSDLVGYRYTRSHHETATRQLFSKSFSIDFLVLFLFLLTLCNGVHKKIVSKFNRMDSFIDWSIKYKVICSLFLNTESVSAMARNWTRTQNTIPTRLIAMWWNVEWNRTIVQGLLLFMVNWIGILDRKRLKEGKKRMK